MSKRPDQSEDEDHHQSLTDRTKKRDIPLDDEGDAAEDTHDLVVPPEPTGSSDVPEGYYTRL